MAKNKINHFREEEIKCYEQVERLYTYTYNTEKKAIFNLTSIFRETAEKEGKIEEEVQINFVSIVQTEFVKNF